MSQYIIYPKSDGGIAIVIPAPECDLPIEEIALKDVPAGAPYLIVSEENIPADIDFFEAWEADFSNPDGYGIGQEAWAARRAG